MSTDEKGESQENCAEKGGIHSFVQSLALASTWLFSLAVIGTGIISAMLFIYGFLLSISGFISNDDIIHSGYPHSEGIPRYID